MKQLSLKHFVVRSQVLSLYRDIMRTVMQIDDQYYRRESNSEKINENVYLDDDFYCTFFFSVKQWARLEFNRQRTLKDLGEIRTQVVLGRRNLNELKLSMKMAS